MISPDEKDDLLSLTEGVIRQAIALTRAEEADDVTYEQDVLDEAWLDLRDALDELTDGPASPQEARASEDEETMEQQLDQDAALIGAIAYYASNQSILRPKDRLSAIQRLLKETDNDSVTIQLDMATSDHCPGSWCRPL